MNVANETKDVSMRFTLKLKDGAPVTSNVDGDQFDYTPGHEQIMPALEEALQGAVKGEKKQFILSPAADPGLKLDVTRLALLLGHPGETLILEVEIL
jgi:FKBP-type peptidyl-prolyl cis-trans isomerase 2